MSDFYHNTIRWLSGHMLTCPWRKFFHMDCPGCGFQRSLAALLNGNLHESFALYPATIPVLFALSLVPVNFFFDLRWAKKLGTGSFIFSLVVIFIFYIYKIINHQIFH